MVSDLGGGEERVVKAAKCIMIHLHDSWGDFKKFHSDE